MHFPRIALLSLLVALGTSPAVAGPARAGAAEGEVAPDFSLPATDGRARGLADFLGRPVVVSFWAAWCSPCLEELPLLDALHQRLAGAASVLAVNIDEVRANGEAVVRRSGLALPVLFDTDQAVVARWRPPAMPTTWLLGADGVVIWCHKGAMDATQIEALEARVRALIPSDDVAPEPPPAQEPRP